MSSLQYITNEGERWDNIAFAAYGDALKMAAIIDANPDVPLDTVFKAGTRLLIPILETSTETTDDSLLPPWKRANKKSVVPLPDFNTVPVDSPGSYDGSFDESYD
jgi:phage tail protein X